MVFRIVYEGLPSICYKCECYGHAQIECPSEVEGRKVNRPTSRDSWPTPSSGENLDADQSGFGPWMQAPGRKRRAEGKSAAITFGKNPSGDKSSLKSTRFDVLMTLEESKVEGFGEDLTEEIAAVTTCDNGKLYE